MALSFPNSPTLNDIHSHGGKSWQWNGAMWVAINAGVQGPQGIQGTQGTQGLQGAQGTQGQQGIQGVQGTQGTQGLQGTQGTQGLQGIQGIQGIQGTLGAQGSVGAQGTQGIQGIQGIQGRQGIQGTLGTQGAIGAQGATGTQGTQGIQGIQGRQGITGANGTNGTNGTQGAVGSTGATGSTGSTGAQGAQGTSGATIDNTERTLARLYFTGVGGNSNVIFGGDHYSIGQASGSWTHPYPDLIIGYHTGIRIGAYWNYGGTRFYNNSPTSNGGGETEIFSVGNGDNYVRVAEIGYAGSSFRAPIFYDSNDTAYYTNPNSTSNIYALTAYSLQGNGNVGGTGSASWHPSGIYSAGFNWLYGGINAGGSSVTNMSDARANIFYDYNDTTYYADPASTSWLRHLSVGDVNAANDGSWNARLNLTGSSHARLDVKSNSDGIITSLYSHTGNGVGRVGTMSNHPLAFMVNGGIAGYAYTNYLQGVDSVRAPIFYDSGNTGYYVDPASDANIAGYVYSGNSYTYGWFRNQGDQGLYNSSYGNHFYATSDSQWNIAGNGTSNTGLAMRSGGHNGTIRGYLYGDSSNNFGLLGSTGGWRLRIVENDWVLVDGSSIRAPLFYDSNNTGYYTDPASTSNLNALTANSTFTVNNGWSYLANNYGYGVVGLYDSTIFQLVFAMGNSYKTTAGGGINNLYGIAWSHPNAGGIAGNLDSHGLIVAINGGFGSCMAYSIKASSNVTAYSDERLKKDWSDLPKNYIEELAKVKVGTYTRIDGEKLRQVGVSAQSLRPLLPEAVIEATDDFKTLSVAYGNAAMASAVELAKEVVSLKEQLAAVLDRLNKLENK